VTEKKNLKNMTEAEVKETYKKVLKLVFSKTSRAISEETGLSVPTVNGMLRRLKRAGFDLPRVGKADVLKDEEFLSELKGFYSDIREEKVAE